MRVGAELRDQPRVALVDLLEREPARLLHQRDEAEVPRAEHDDLPVRDVVLRTLPLLLVGSSGRLADGEPDHRMLLVAAGDLLDRPVLERALDELIQPVAVPLLEGRALCLSVIGEHDDLVGTRRVAARAVDAPELLVQLAQRLESVRPLEPRMVRDLVVARERRVDSRPAAHHVRQHAVDDQVPDDHAHRAAQERIDAAAVPSRPHIAPDCSERRSPLEDHLPREEDERSRDVETVREERAIAGVRLLLGLHPADGEDHLLGLAREQVAAARAAIDEQADARGAVGLDARAVGGSGACREQAALLVHPAERRVCRRWSRAGSLPGWLPSGRRGPSPTRSARACPRRASEPCWRRSRPASRAGAPGARARRSRGR